MQTAANKPKSKRVTTATLKKEIALLQEQNQQLMQKVGELTGMYLNAVAEVHRLSARNAGETGRVRSVALAIIKTLAAAGGLTKEEIAQFSV